MIRFVSWDSNTDSKVEKGFIGRYRIRKMIRESGALIQARDGEDQNEGHEHPEENRSDI